jgi:hypothetical protein
MENQETGDPTLEEIWAIREQIAAEHGYDVRRLGEHYVEYQKQFADRLVSPPRRQDRPNRKPAA